MAGREKRAVPTTLSPIRVPFQLAQKGVTAHHELTGDGHMAVPGHHAGQLAGAEQAAQASKRATIMPGCCRSGRIDSDICPL